MKRELAFIVLACLTLGACSTAYDRVAKRGNQYCDVKPDSVNAVKDSVNTNLRNAGAKFTFNGITCD